MVVVRYLLLVISTLCLFPSTPSGATTSVNELNRLVTTLWNLDRAEMASFLQRYQLNKQGRVSYTKNIPSDVANGNLFTGISMAKLRSKPTIDAFLNLMDNYIQSVGIRETTNTREEQEINTFLNTILRTPVMQKLHEFLVRKRLSPSRLSDFKRQLYNIWFRFYRRNGPNDSSAFEHVFVGETRQRTVLGLHNWIRFFQQEQAGVIDYYGYKKICGTPPSSISVTFRIGRDAYKLVGGMFVGTSPEFELAVYTALYLTEKMEIPLSFGTCSATVTCHRFGGGTLSSCFPKF